MNEIEETIHKYPPSSKIDQPSWGEDAIKDMIKDSKLNNNMSFVRSDLKHFQSLCREEKFKSNDEIYKAYLHGIDTGIRKAIDLIDKNTTSVSAVVRQAIADKLEKESNNG